MKASKSSTKPANGTKPAYRVLSKGLRAAVKAQPVTVGEPKMSCPRCHTSRYWLAPFGVWRCGVCHPDPATLRTEWEARGNQWMNIRLVATGGNER